MHFQKYRISKTTKKKPGQSSLKPTKLQRIESLSTIVKTQYYLRQAQSSCPVTESDTKPYPEKHFHILFLEDPLKHYPPTYDLSS
jgi:hypothetical protein